MPFGRKKRAPDVPGAMTADDLVPENRSATSAPAESAPAEDALEFPEVDAPSGLHSRFNNVTKWVMVELSKSVIINGQSFGPGPTAVPEDAFDVWRHAI